jgi:hypothetical protein
MHVLGQGSFAKIHRGKSRPAGGILQIGITSLASLWMGIRLSVFQPRNLPRGVPEVDVCGLTKIGNLKERHMVHNLDRFWPLGA